MGPRVYEQKLTNLEHLNRMLGSSLIVNFLFTTKGSRRVITCTRGSPNKRNLTPSEFENRSRITRSRFQKTQAHTHTHTFEHTHTQQHTHTTQTTQTTHTTRNTCKKTKREREKKKHRQTQTETDDSIATTLHQIFL